MKSAETVYVVDDDPGVLKALTRLLQASGYSVAAFLSPLAFLDGHDPVAPGCLVLDVAMPELNGLELQRRLVLSGSDRAIVFISGQGDIPMSVRAMKAGATDFLPKPFDDAQLLAAIGTAIEKNRALSESRARKQAVARRLATLTLREREVLELVVSGQLNKHIANQLGTVEKTIKVHRARVMRKMGAASLADLVRMAERAGIGSASRPSGN